MDLVNDNPSFAREGFPRFWRRGSRMKRMMIAFVYIILAMWPTAAVIQFWEPLGAAANGMLPGILLAPLSYWPAFLAPVIAPALTAGAIAGERERRSWDLLVLTRLTAREIVWGKLLSRLMPLFWITLPFIPLMVTLLVLSGGANPWMSVSAFSMRATPKVLQAWPLTVLPWVGGLLVAFANAVMALYVSFRSSSTRSAMIVAYGIAVGAYMFVTMIVGALSMLIFIPAMRNWVPSAHGPSAPPFPMQGMTWLIVAGQSVPFLWGVLVPLVLLPMMMRRFHKLDARTRAG